MIEYKNLDISELVSLAKERDDSAFAELVSRYTPMMRKLLGAFNNPSISYDEAFAEACIGLHKALGSYDPERGEITFGLYARICIYRRLTDFYSSIGANSHDSECDVDRLTSSGSVMSMLIFKERIQQFISVARGLLSKYEYQVFLLYIQGLDTEAMCEELGRDRKSIENAKARMLKNLRSNEHLFSDI